jgi:hypothetical protein
MHTQISIQKTIEKSLSNIHLKRANSLVNAASSLLNGAALTVSSLGRHMPGKALEKSKIHRADAIVGNGLLYRDKLLITRSLVSCFFGGRPTLYVLIDWSGCCSDERYILQASIANNGLGRSQPIYSRIHGKNKGEWVKAQDLFLEELSTIFSTINSKIVIITDSGFYASWFKKVKRLGWDYVGRVRGTVTIRFEGTEDWKTVPEVYSQATNKVHSLGQGTLGKDKKNNIDGFLYLIKKKKRGRKKPAHKKRYPQEEKQYEDMYKHPWLLISSIEAKEALDIVRFYALRMQVEQNFRDVKSSYYGFGLEHSGTKDFMRLENLLLIAIIATLMAIIIGLAAEKSNLHWEYQANTIRTRRVLSLVYLGGRIWKEGLHKIPIVTINNTIEYFRFLQGES